MQITFDKKNYRKHSEQNKKRIRKSLADCGAGRSVLVDKEGCLIAGNGVYEQAEKMGIKTRVIETDGTELVVVKRTDLATDDQRRKLLALADNATSDHVEWDFENIDGEFDIDTLADFGIDCNVDIKEKEEAKEDDFDEEKDPVATICQEGDIWQLGEHRLMCGDSTKAEDVARLMDGEKAQLVITDPPYNVAIGSKNKALNEMQKWGRIIEDIIGDKGMTDEEIGEKIWAPAFKNLCDFATDDCAIYVSMPQGGTHMMMMMMMMSRYWQVKHELIWLKNAPTFSMGRLNYDYKHEPIVYGWKKKHNWYAKEPKQSILCFDKPKKCDLHPTMKPIALWAELICNSSQEGMIVSDFFGGSGTTIMACEQLHRKARLMELDPHYCDVIIARWEKLTGQKAIKL